MRTEALNKACFLLGLLLLVSGVSVAQQDSVVLDSQKVGLPGFPPVPRTLADVARAPLLDSLDLREPIKENLMRMVFSFNNTRSLFQDPSYQMNGIRLGLELQRRHRFGIEFNTLGDSLLSSVDSMQAGGATRASQEFSGLSLFWEYVVLSDFRWELSLPVSAGVGNGTISYFDGNNDRLRRENVQNVSMFTAGVSAHYKIIPWLGVGTGAGFRQVTTPQDQFRRNLTTPYYVIKAKFFFGYFVKTIFNPEVIRQEKEAYQLQKAERREARRARRQGQVDPAN